MIRMIVGKEKIHLIFISIIYLLSYLALFGFFGGARYYLLYLFWSIYIIWIVNSGFRGGFNILFWRIKTNIVLFSVVLALIQIIVFVFLGFIYGFGYSPYSHNMLGILSNTLFFLIPLLAREFLRSYVVKKSSVRFLTNRYILISLFLGLIAIPLSNYKILFGRVGINILKFMGWQLIPSLVTSLFATYILILGGPLASIAYYIMIYGFEWYMPILPKLEWTISALVNVFIPSLGFIFVGGFSTPYYFKRVGLVARSVKVRSGYISKEYITTLFLIIFIVWGSSGLLGVYPSVILTGSMAPSLNVGDFTFVKSVPIQSIHIGDMIQYYTPDGIAIIHRVIERGDKGGLTYFIVKGDANNLADTPVYSMQVRGKVILSIPKVGWAVIYLKSFVNILYDLILTNLRFSIIMLSTAVSVGLWMKRRGLQNMFRGYRRRF